jgi:hypothetical protein
MCVVDKSKNTIVDEVVAVKTSPLVDEKISMDIEIEVEGDNDLGPGGTTAVVDGVNGSCPNGGDLNFWNAPKPILLKPLAYVFEKYPLFSHNNTILMDDSCEKCIENYSYNSIHPLPYQGPTYDLSNYDYEENDDNYNNNDINNDDNDGDNDGDNNNDNNDNDNNNNNNNNNDNNNNDNKNNKNKDYNRNNNDKAVDDNNNDNNYNDNKVNKLNRNIANLSNKYLNKKLDIVINVDKYNNDDVYKNTAININSNIGNEKDSMELMNDVTMSNNVDMDILNPNILHPDTLNPDNPDTINPDILNPDTLNPDILNPDTLNPDILNPDTLNPDTLNPDILNPDIRVDNENYDDYYEYDEVDDELRPYGKLWNYLGENIYMNAYK